LEQYSIALLAAVFGAVFGSFLNVVIVRLPQGKSVAYPASHCPKCGESLRWWHNIPLLSWLFLRGRCAYCKEPISPVYPFVELATALIFAALFYKEGPTLTALAYSLSFSLLLALSLIDLRYKAVPDSLNLLAFILAVAGAKDPLAALHDGLLMAGGFSMLRFFVSYYVSKKVDLQLRRERKRTPWLSTYHPKYVMIEAMGEGDVIVAATMGAILGLKGSLLAIFLAALLALPASVVRSRISGDTQLPFIPFLALGAFIAYLYSHDIVQLLGAG
jgi:leader peptidase (prepilin peptidase)/N-methyltransferase